MHVVVLVDRVVERSILRNAQCFLVINALGDVRAEAVHNRFNAAFYGLPFETLRKGVFPCHLAFW